MASPVRYLQVNIDIPNNAGTSDAFKQYMGELLQAGSFTDVPWPGWELFLAANRQASQDSADPPIPDDRITYFHIWRVRDYNTLPYLMQYFDDDQLYRQLDGLVLQEIQDFTGAVPYNPQSQNPEYQPPKDTAFYLSLCLDTIVDAAKLEQFNARMTDIANTPGGDLKGWSFVYGTYAQTGQLRRYFQVWATSTPLPQPEAAIKWLIDDPDNTAIKAVLDTAYSPNPQWSLWQPVDYLKGS